MVRIGEDVSLATKSFGDRLGRPTLLMHGAGTSMVSWHDDFCLALAARGLYVVRYDRRDTGRSTMTDLGNPPYGMTDLLQDAIQLMDHFGFDQTNLVGLSQGTALGQLLAIRHPDRVASLTLISGTSDFSPRPGSDLPGPTPRPAETSAAEEDAEEDDERDWTDRDATVAYLIESERQVGGSIFDEALTREVAERTFDTTVSLPHQLINTTMFGPPEPWRDRLGDIAAPTLVIHGSEDLMFPLPHGEAMAREIPRAQLLVLNGVGHGNLPRSSWPRVIDAIASVAR